MKLSSVLTFEKFHHKSPTGRWKFSNVSSILIVDIRFWSSKLTFQKFQRQNLEYLFLILRSQLAAQFNTYNHCKADFWGFRQGCAHVEWWRRIIIKRATNYRALLRKMTYKNKACTHVFCAHVEWWRRMIIPHLNNPYIHTGHIYM